MFTTGDLLKRLNISRPTLYKICKQKNISPKKTVGGNFRFSEEDLKKILNDFEIDTSDIETKFINAINDVWIILKNLAEDIWGFGVGEDKLINILKENKREVFLLNASQFR